MTQLASIEDRSGYQTTPPNIDRMPSGVPYIVGNEAAERFSYYGMRAILTVFMTEHLVGSSGELATMSEEDAKSWFHLFVAAGYFFPVFGAIVADWLLGKYRTILLLSIVYCLGHLALAVDETRVGLFTGLALIAVAMGAIKPCVSAHVGDQFGRRNSFLLTRVFTWFYFSINVGACVSSLVTPVLLKNYGPQIAFGVPGVLMALATFVFWLGRYEFVHIPARGSKIFSDLLKPDFIKAMLALVPIYACVALFWSLFDQTGSAWVLQAKKMDRTFLGLPLDSSQIQAANPALILVLVPTFSFVIYPVINLVWKLTPLRKIGLGLALTATPFVISAFIEHAIMSGQTPNIGWQLLAYVILTAAEVMVSITCLEFSYTQAPPSMKSIVMSFYLLSVTAGNLITALVNKTTKLSGANYYWFFSGMMAIAAIAYIFVALTYRGRTFIQGENPEVETAAT